MNCARLESRGRQSKQPRSGERMSAHAVRRGSKSQTGPAPEGRKKNSHARTIVELRSTGSRWRLSLHRRERNTVTDSKADFFTLNEIDAQRASGNKRYQEFLRVPAMSAGLYVLPAGAADPQRPHHEDEMYYVVRGRARFRAGDEDTEISREACCLWLPKSSTGSTKSGRTGGPGVLRSRGELRSC